MKNLWARLGLIGWEKKEADAELTWLLFRWLIMTNIYLSLNKIWALNHFFKQHYTTVTLRIIYLFYSPSHQGHIFNVKQFFFVHDPKSIYFDFLPRWTLFVLPDHKNCFPVAAQAVIWSADGVSEKKPLADCRTLLSRGAVHSAPSWSCLATEHWQGSNYHHTQKERWKTWPVDVLVTHIFY